MAKQWHSLWAVWMPKEMCALLFFRRASGLHLKQIGRSDYAITICHFVLIVWGCFNQKRNPNGKIIRSLKSTLLFHWHPACHHTCTYYKQGFQSVGSKACFTEVVHDCCCMQYCALGCFWLYFPQCKLWAAAASIGVLHKPLVHPVVSRCLDCV